MSNETRERDIYLAVAMGWRYVPPGPETAVMYGEGVHCLRDPEGRFWVAPLAINEAETWTDLAPEFHEWESAKAKLLRWLAADDNRWHRFDDAFYQLNPVVNESGYCRAAFLATPAQVAEAAEKAMRGMETAKSGNGGEE